MDIFTVPVKQINGDKAHSRKQKAVESMKRRVPDRDFSIIIMQFSQDHRCENETVDDALEEPGDLHLQRTLQEAGENEQHKSQQAHRRALIVMDEDASDQRDKHHEPQNRVQNKRPLVFLDSVMQSS